MLGAGVGVCETALFHRAAGGGGDTTPPGQVTDLAFSGPPGIDDCYLAFTTPGDNGFSGGLCAYLEVRGSDGFDINSEARWNAAQILDGPWTPNVVAPGQYQERYLTGLFGSLFIAVRFKDAAGNVGAISNRVAHVW